MKNPFENAPSPLTVMTPQLLAQGLTNEVFTIIASCPTVAEVGQEAFEKASEVTQNTIYQILLMTIETSMAKGRSMAESGRKPSVN